MTKKAFILVGVPGSGKSTWLKKEVTRYEEEGNKVGVFSLDQCRLDLAGTTNYAVAFKNAMDKPTEFDAQVNVDWYRTISKKMIVIMDGRPYYEQNDVVFVDNVNASRKQRTRWITDLKTKGFEVHAVQFVVPLEVAIARQSTRGDKFVPADVITRMYYSIQEVLVPSECQSVTHVKSF